MRIGKYKKIYFFKKKSLDFNNISILENKNISIRIFMRDKELYEFVKQDIKRASYIFKELFQNRKDVLIDIVTKYDNERK
ncbi:plasmid partition family protein (plasmid) [Borreliella burgdorferi]